MLCIPWILSCSVMRCLRCTSHRKLIHISLTENYSTCLLKVNYCFCRKCRHKILKYSGTACRKHSLGTHVVLNCNRHTCKRSCKFTRINLSLNFIRLSKCCFLRCCNVAVKFSFLLINLVICRKDCFPDGNFFGFYLSAKLYCCQTHQIHVYILQIIYLK